MPTYTYECSSCEIVYDEILPMAEMSNPTQLPCKFCGKEDSIKKIIGGMPGTVKPDPFKGLSSDHKWAMNQMRRRHPKSTIKDY